VAPTHRIFSPFVDGGLGGGSYQLPGRLSPSHHLTISPSMHWCSARVVEVESARCVRVRGRFSYMVLDPSCGTASKLAAAFPVRMCRGGGEGLGCAVSVPCGCSLVPLINFEHAGCWLGWVVAWNYIA
jgi:hypothetical protein